MCGFDIIFAFVVFIRKLSHLLLQIYLFVSICEKLQKNTGIHLLALNVAHNRRNRYFTQPPTSFEQITAAGYPDTSHVSNTLFFSTSIGHTWYPSDPRTKPENVVHVAITALHHHRFNGLIPLAVFPAKWITTPIVGVEILTPRKGKMPLILSNYEFSVVFHQGIQLRRKIINIKDWWSLSKNGKSWRWTKTSTSYRIKLKKLVLELLAFNDIAEELQEIIVFSVFCLFAAYVGECQENANCFKALSLT